jgi:hypothetical protein
LPKIRAHLGSPAVNSAAYKGRGRVLNLHYPYLWQIPTSLWSTLLTGKDSSWRASIIKRDDG